MSLWGPFLLNTFLAISPQYTDPLHVFFMETGAAFPAGASCSAMKKSDEKQDAFACLVSMLTPNPCRSQYSLRIPSQNNEVNIR